MTRFAQLLIVSLCLICKASWCQDHLNTRLLDQWSDNTLPANSSKVRYSDCYGFVWKGVEYAVLASTSGTHVFEISSSNSFKEVGFLKGKYANSSAYHRDYAVFKNYLYVVGDEGKSSLQIIDFSYLPDSIHLAREDSVQFGRSHNLFIDTLNETLYSCIHRSTTSTQSIAAPMKVFSLVNPLFPSPLWEGPNDIEEVHDCYVRNRFAILNCGYDGIRTYDFSNPANPVIKDNVPVYNEQGYNHQGWLAPNGTTYLFADETNGKRIKKCSLNNGQLKIESYFGTNYQNGSVPHNIMCTDTFAFVAYYNEGLRIYDIRTKIPTEIAFYDTYSENTNFQQNGNWGVYSLLPSGRLLASDRQNGLFLIEFNRKDFALAPSNEPRIYPNPVNSDEKLHLRFEADVVSFEVEVFDCFGRLVYTESVQNSNNHSLTLDLRSGQYILNVVTTDVSGLTDLIQSRVVVY